MIAVEFIFWLCLGAILHTYITYPLSLRLLRPRYRTPPMMADDAWPTVAVLVPAYNEEQVIGAKLENCLALDYDPAKIEILVGSDGSTDRTAEIVKECTDKRVRFFDYGSRNGKPGILNKLVKETSADILVLTDANVTISPDTFRNLIRHFADSSVAGVATAKNIVGAEIGSQVVLGEHRYASLVSKLKEREAAVGGYSGALGAYYAMRRGLYREFPLVPMNDDILGLYRAVRSGMRVAFEPSAVGTEDAGASVGVEFKRRIRIGASNYKTLELCRTLLSLSRPAVAYTFFSHKVLRWIFPFLMIAVLIANVLLVGESIYQWLFRAQLIGYGIALLGWFLDLLRVRIPVISTVYHFAAMNLALFFGFFVYLRGIKSAAWERTPRESLS